MVIFWEIDGDGVVIFWEIDGDGVVIFWEIDGDGVVIFWEVDGDGVVIFWEIDGDGVVIFWEVVLGAFDGMVIFVLFEELKLILHFINIFIKKIRIFFIKVTCIIFFFYSVLLKKNVLFY